MIENVDTNEPADTFPTEGTFIVRYGANGTLVNEGIGSTSAPYAATYIYNAESDTIVNVVSVILNEENTPVLTRYTFDSSTSGTWTQAFNENITYSGSFTLIDETYSGFAPSTLSGKKADITFITAVSDLPDGSYVTEGVATHFYNTETGFTTDGSQVNVDNTTGTYEAEKLSSNRIRDKGFNLTFGEAYEIVYTFTTLSSGTFTENWNNGEILWTGTFEMTDIEE